MNIYISYFQSFFPRANTNCENHLCVIFSIPGFSGVDLLVSHISFFKVIILIVSSVA